MVISIVSVPPFSPLPDDWALELEEEALSLQRHLAAHILRYQTKQHPRGSIGYNWAAKILCLDRETPGYPN